MTIDDPQNPQAGTFPFKLWPAQVPVMCALMQEDAIIFLKARQLGISWLVCAYALWRCLTMEGRTGLLYSQGQLEADELLRRITVMYQRLPLWLREMFPPMAKGLNKYIGWENGSHVRSLPCTKKAGRSFTASFVVLDENAHMEHAETLEAAVAPTIDNGGQLIKISTANGIGNAFYDDWVKAEAGESDFEPIFLDVWSRPDRDEAWYERKRRNASNPSLFLQEYPRFPEESFINSGTPRFLHDWIVAQRPNVEVESWSTDDAPESFPFELSGIPGLRVYKWPELDRQYVIAADPSEGLPHSDPSPITVIDRETWEEVAVLYGRFEPTLLAIHADAIGRVYNDAEAAVMRNNHGHAMLAKLVELGYPYIVKYPKDGREGWPENVQTKVQMVDDMAGALKDEVVTIHSAATLTELRMYQKLDNGKTGAPPGKHDDLCTTWFLLATYLTGPKPYFHSPMAGSHHGALPGASGASGLGVRSRLPIGGWRPPVPTSARGGLRRL